jgi:C1A family cysteine protease
MFRTLFLLASFFYVVSSEGLRGADMSGFLNESDEWKQFSNFQDKFAKKYGSIDELENRFQIFRTNLRNIIIHNLDRSQNFTMGVNQFTDLTPEEFKSQYVNSGIKTTVGGTTCGSFSSSASGAPVSIDWRNKGAVTSVKDQGQCGSCWTFSSTGAVEGAWAISKGQLIDFSEEQLVECAGLKYGSMGCNGGSMEGAFNYIIANGQCTASAYPYTSGTGTSGACKSCSAVAHLASCSDVKPNDQISLKAAVARQPVSVAIEADTRYFQSYSGGVLTSSSCGTNLDHGVLVVGYGTENGIDYWLVKNSWGTTWGDHGYVKIGKSSSTNDPGICGISMMPSFPTV